MAKINLIPLEMRGLKQETPLSVNLGIALKILVALNIFFFAGGIALRFISWSRVKGLDLIVAEYQRAEGLSRKMHAIKQEQEKLSAELSSLKGHMKRDILWSEKLKQLSQIIPADVWLNSISFKRNPGKDSLKRVLSIKGSLRPLDKGSFIVVLSKFINVLKEDKVFLEDFESPVLTDSRTELQDGVEVMSFAIEMPFKKDAGQ